MKVKGKENKLIEACGLIDEKYVAEAAEISRSKAPRRLHRSLLPAAALIAAALAVVGFTVASRYYFAPGVGVIDDNSSLAPGVWACYEEMKLGDAVIDAVMLTEGEKNTAGEKTYSLSLWLWRENSVVTLPPGDFDKTGNLPGEATKLTLIIDGANYTEGYGGGSLKGFWNYTFINLPLTDTVTLRDCAGNETTLSLIPIEESRYAYLKPIEFGKNALSVVPMSGTKNLFAASLTAPLAQAVASRFTGTKLLVDFCLLREDGKIGYASGNAFLRGSRNHGNGGIKVRNSDYGYGVEQLMLRSVRVRHTTDIHQSDSSTLRIRVTVPAEGEGYVCDYLLFDAEGITCRAVRIEYTDTGLSAVMECENRTGEKYLGSLSAHAGFCVGNESISHLSGTEEYGYFTYDSGKPEFVPLAPGDTVDMYLESLSYFYEPEQYDKNELDTAQQLGSISLK